MKLLIVESPSKAKTINNYLGKDFKVTSSFGHIRSLPSQNGSVLPDEDFKMVYEVIDRSKKHVDQIYKLAKEADEVYLATDPDREGEAISWHISEFLKSKKGFKTKMRRVVFHEITKKAVLEAIANSREIDNSLVHAQQTRQALDYLVGFTLSPVLWRKLPGSRSAGRVQSVALRVICDREIEIEKFKTDEYWSITAECKNTAKDIFLASLTHFDSKKLDKLSINSESMASTCIEEAKSHTYKISDIKKKQIRSNPHAPFTTSTMLQEAARKLGYSAKKTSKLAQDLYEGYDIGGEVTGLITYMRTDSVTVSADAIESARSYINPEFGSKYLPTTPKFYKTKTKNAQEAHEAIRPTNFKFSPSTVKKFLENDHFKLYELIWKRMIASQMESAILDNVSADIKSENGKITFSATGSTLTFDGFYKLYGHKLDDDTQKLPKLEVGESIDVKKLLPKQHFTQPPPRYTEASLVKKMEELGIGRPSTYPAIIAVLQEREYVKVDKKRFFPENKGRVVSAFLLRFFEQYVEYDFTAELENELDEISNGKLDWKKMLKAFWTPFKKRTDEVLEIKNIDIVKKIEESLENFIFDDPNDKSCPTCKTGTLGLKTGKFGAFLGCSNYPECKHTKQLTKPSTDADGEAPTDSGSAFPKILGTNTDGKEVSIRKGPYGPYIQVGDGKEVKRISLPKGKTPEMIELPYALLLATLPRVLGEHPESGEKIKAGIGRFGPYIEHLKKFKSLKSDDPVSITLERAIEVLNQPTLPRGGKRKK